MEKLTSINPKRIAWCCDDFNITLDELARATNIAPGTLRALMHNNDGITVRQLSRIAEYFGRGILFFGGESPVDEKKIHSLQFRTIAGQKPDLNPKIKTLIERVERQREIYLYLREETSLPVPATWHDMANGQKGVKDLAEKARQLLGLNHLDTNFISLRKAVEKTGILVFLSNGYQGKWQIPKESPIRGFSLFHKEAPVIFIKKMSSGGGEHMQSFTLMHELGHLLKHGNTFIDDENNLYSRRGREKEANDFAGNILVPNHFLREINMSDFPKNNVREYDSFLREFANQWGISTWGIVLRLLNENKIDDSDYREYHAWRHRNENKFEVSEGRQSGHRRRHREPFYMFGRPFVSMVFDALSNKHITLAKANNYLDGIGIVRMRQLEQDNVLR